MKHLILICLITALSGPNAYSQSTGKITIRKNVNGEETVIEREFDTSEEIDVEELLEEYGLDIDIDVDVEEGARILEIIVDEDSDHEGPYRFKTGCEYGSKAFFGVTSGAKSDGTGAYVGSVIEGSSAEAMGVRTGDLITEFNGEKIYSFTMLREAVRDAEPGDDVTVKVERDGKRKNLKGEVGQKEDDDSYSFFYEDGDDEFHYEFDTRKLENMLEELEVELEGLDGKDLHFEFNGEDLEAWGERFAEKMEDWAEGFEESIESHHNTRTVVIIVEDISREEADAVNQQADPKLSTVNNLDLGELRFYPNPGDGNFELSFVSPSQGDLDLMIYDNQGKKVYYEMLGDFEGRYENEIDISRRPAGNYFLQIEQGGKTYSRKIVKE